MSASAPPKEETWRRLAQAGLEGSTIDKLTASTPEGLSIEPLFLPRHLTALSASSNSRAVPFARSSGRWAVAERLRLGQTSARDGASKAKAAGAEAIWLEGDAGQPQAAWEAFSAAVGSDVPVSCDARFAAPAAHDALKRGGTARVSALFDPIGALAVHGAPTGGLDVAWSEARRLCLSNEGAGPLVRALAASGSLVHEAGGHAALEIGFVLASLAEAARRLEPLGVELDRVLRSTALVMTAGVDQFAAIAKLRALRLAHAKLAVALGSDAPPAPFVVGHVSRRAQSRVDAPTNFIRATIEVFALAIGGADVIVGRAFDDLADQPTALGHRVARTTELVLREESHLADVADAAAGSYYLESLTDGLARAGWEELRAIEREGGVVRSLESGAFASRVRRAADAAEADVRKRKRVIVGTSDYAAPGELLAAPSAPHMGGGALGPVRLTEPFEAVRERAGAMSKAGGPPQAVLVRLGPPSEWRAREEFSRRFFEAGGFEVRSAAAEEGAALAKGSARTAFVLCGSDARYAEAAVATTQELVAAGARAVALAGKPGALEAPLRQAGLASEIFLGCDAPKVLGTILDQISGKDVAS